jgi:hypothetical protein
VQRARNVDQKIASIPEPEERKNEKRKFKSRCIFRKETMRTVEMKITTLILQQKISNEHPDNKNRGNIKLDE